MLGLVLGLKHLAAAELRSPSITRPPDIYKALVGGRTIINDYITTHHQVAPGLPPRSIPKRPIQQPIPDAIRVIFPDQSLSSINGGQIAAVNSHIPKGFRAPILEYAGTSTTAFGQPETLNEKQRSAAAYVDQHLANAGLIRTLEEVIRILGPDRFAKQPEAGLSELRTIGFPEDLLAAFTPAGRNNSPTTPAELIASVASNLLRDSGAARVSTGPPPFEFYVPDEWTGFEVAVETGSKEVQLLRMQAGGGYRNGVVPGDSIDVIRQVVEAMPACDFLVTAPEAMLEPVTSWAMAMLPFSRPHQLTLLAEPGAVEAWAQDNGKPGTIALADDQRERATITPRYASRGELNSTPLVGESFVMDMLARSGRRVVQFPLLFQGGNLIGVRDPKTERRILITSETAIYRNTMLGLSPGEVEKVFRRGFGVDECMVVPAVSYHLDFDATFREIDGELVVFVNDMDAAVRGILGLAIATFEQHGLLDRAEAVGLRYDLNRGAGRTAYRTLSQLSGRDADGLYRSDRAILFKTSVIDSASGNYQVFLQALDLLQSRFDFENDPTIDVGRRNYLATLRGVSRALTAQEKVFASRGWKVVRVPSLPNFPRGINYLNGVQHPDGYLMPAYGGFYTPLDQEAARIFKDAIGHGAEVRPIQCAELQRREGAVHCAVVAYTN
ncbi:hypothetical protein GC207_11585 [bacterium]|nr:hypothetical protein [bacterium]